MALARDLPCRVRDLLDGLLDVLDALFGDLLDLPHGLIRLAAGAQSVVTGQRAAASLTRQDPSDWLRFSVLEEA